MSAVSQIATHFKGKEDLFFVLVEERIDARLARVDEAADRELSSGAAPLEAARRARLTQGRISVRLLWSYRRGRLSKQFLPRLMPIGPHGPTHLQYAAATLLAILRLMHRDGHSIEDRGNCLLRS